MESGSKLCSGGGGGGGGGAGEQGGGSTDGKVGLEMSSVRHFEVEQTRLKLTETAAKK